MIGGMIPNDSPYHSETSAVSTRMCPSGGMGILINLTLWGIIHYKRCLRINIAHVLRLCTDLIVRENSNCVHFTWGQNHYGA